MAVSPWGFAGFLQSTVIAVIDMFDKL